jgi:hypothetical protein
MGTKTPKAPVVPDYNAAAAAQGTANITAAEKTAALSNPNIIGPYGNQTVTYAADASGNMQPTVTQTLNPEAQKALDAQQKVQSSLAGLGLNLTNQATGSLSTPFKYVGPDIQTSLTPQKEINYGIAADKYGLAGSVDPSKYGKALQNLDLSGVAKMPVNAGMTGQEAIMARLQPQIQQTEAAMAQRLANQGITAGSEAYNNAMRTQGQQSNDLYTQAALQGLNLDLAANQQGYGQALSSAGLYNQGLGQNFGQGLSAQELQNQAIGQNYGQGMQSAGFYNQAQNQSYNQDLQAKQFGNTAAQQSLAQQLQLRNQPLNEINALMSGSQVQTPTFQGYTGANVAAAPTFQGAQAQGTAAMDMYGQQMAARNANVAALGSLAGGVAGMATAPLGGSLFGKAVGMK